MAKKKDDNELKYLQMPLPKGQGYRFFKVAWSGLNRTEEIDTGELSDASNVSTDDAPYISPCEMKKEYLTGAEKWLADHTLSNLPFSPYPYLRPLSIHSSEDKLYVTYDIRQSDGDERTPGVNAVFIDVMKLDDSGVKNPVVTGLLTVGNDNLPRNYAQFNVYHDLYDPVSSNVHSRLIIFPERATMYTDTQEMTTAVTSHTPSVTPSARYAGKIIYAPTPQESDYEHERRFFECVGDGQGGYMWHEITYVSDTDSYHRRFFSPSTAVNMPNMDYAVAHNSRLFGVGNGRVFASGYNDYSNWSLDTSDEYSESNAWCSSAQSNVKAGTEFTGVTSFKNHVIAFKKGFIHEIYNNKNPFRIADVYSDGTIDNRSIQEVNGNLFFVSENDVLVYTGGTPRVIGRELNIDTFTYAVAGSDNRRYYLYCEDDKSNGYFFIYDTYTGTWSQRDVGISDEDINDGCKKVIGFTHNNRGMFMLAGDGRIYKLDTGEYSCDTDTDNDGIDDTTQYIDWWFETELITRHNLTSSSSRGAMAYSNVNIKHIKKIQMLADIKPGSKFKVYALYDNERFDPEKSQLIYNNNGNSGRVVVRVKLRKTAHYGIKLRVEGQGYVKLYEIELYVENGGDQYK